jgi:hypothetical protein
MSGSATAIETDVVCEATRIIAAAMRAGVSIRLVGGAAIALRARQPIPPVLSRSYGDIDLVTSKGGGPRALELLLECGYSAHERFNAMNGKERLILEDPIHGRHIDVFVGVFRMCHELPLASRLELEERTLPLAELLLSKLQVVELTHKDLQDVYALLLDHPVGDRDGDTINVAYLASVLAHDWGLWRTALGTVETAVERVATFGLQAGQQEVIVTKLARLRQFADAAPKSLRWRTRARVGERVQWYDLPEAIA